MEEMFKFFQELHESTLFMDGPTGYNDCLIILFNKRKDKTYGVSEGGSGLQRVLNTTLFNGNGIELMIGMPPSNPT